MSDTNRDQTISNRLLAALFTNPTTNNVKILEAVKDIAFSSDDAYIEYLRNSSSELEVEYAKEIVLRISLEISPGPPNILIYNLLKFESSVAANTGNHRGFVPRDHFSHLAKLYILGIYVFCYHGGQQSRLLQHFKNEYSQLGHGDGTYTDYIALFVKSWKTFVIYHDIAYPFEFFDPDDLSPDQTNALKPFFNLSAAFEKEMSLRFLSSLISLSLTISSSSFASPPTSVTSRFLSSSQIEMNFDTEPRATITSENLKKYKSIPMSGGKQLVDILASIGRKRNSIITLSNEKSVILIVTIDKAGNVDTRPGSDSKLGIVPSLDLPKKSNGITEVLRLIDNWITEQDGNLIARTYIENLESCVTDFIDPLSPEFKKAFTHLTELVTEDITVPYSELTSFKEIINLRFEVFLSLLRTFDYDYDFVDAANTFELGAKIGARNIHRKEKDLLATATEVICSIILEKIEEAKSEHDQLFANSNEQVVEIVAKKIGKLENIKTQIIRQLDDVHGTTAQKLQNVHRMYHICRGQILPKIFRNLSVDHASIRERALHESMDDVLNQELEKLFGMDISTLNSVYKPKYLGDRKVDHGLAASYLLSKILYRHFNALEGNEIQFKEMLTAPTDGEATAGIEYFLGSGMFDNIARKADVAKIVARNVLLAVTLHNLYPADFTEPTLRKYRTSASKSPFSHFSMLCDALQPWGRRRLSNPGTPFRSDGIPTNSFDLFITNKTITIVCKDVRDFEAYEKRLKTDLGEFLASAPNLIKLVLHGH